MLDPTHDETDFLRRLYERGGRLALHGNMGLFKIDRLFPDYVTRQSAGKDTVHFTLTEKGTQAGRAGTHGEAVITGQQIRAARGILAWDRCDLARKAIVTIYTVERIERGTGISDAAKAKGLTAIKTALEVILPSFFEGKSVIHGSRAWLPSHAGDEDDDDIRDARPIRNY